MLLTDLTRKFPPKLINPPPTNSTHQPDQKQQEDTPKVEIKVEIKTEPQSSKPPPEKKPRIH